MEKKRPRRRCRQKTTHKTLNPIFKPNKQTNAQPTGIDLPAGGEFTRLTPKVTDIVFVSTIKVILKPLVDEVPGFAGVAIALKSPPTIKYRLNFGTLSGGSFTVSSWLLSFMVLLFVRSAGSCFVCAWSACNRKGSERRRRRRRR